MFTNNIKEARNWEAQTEQGEEGTSRLAPQALPAFLHGTHAFSPQIMGRATE